MTQINDPLIFRHLKPQDQPILWIMLMHAAHESSITAVKANVDLVRYVQNWGRAGDTGIICEQGTVALGAAWLRLWSPKDKGYGYLAEGIPELAIAVLPEVRGQGIGTALLQQTLALASIDFPAVCLSIRADNQALRLYEKLGFVPVTGTEVTNRVGSVSFTMIYKFAP